VGAFDCHGYKVRTATEFAPRFVEDCWRRGLPKAKFIHGGSISGRDSIGRRLHKMLTESRFEPYARGPRSDLHHLGSDVLVVALTENSSAERYTRPVAVPQPEYDRTGPD
jgi:hypothetical protein